MVTNVFTYGLVLVAARGLSLNMQYWLYYIIVSLFKHDQLNYGSLFVLNIQEFLVYVILFVGALFASLRNHHNKVIAMPTGMGKVMINISFCFSCFCFCICCSQRCRAKTLRVLILCIFVPFKIIILFSFMSFIYHIIMDVISLGFILFIKEYRTFYISLTLLYMSLILFFVMFTSITIFLISRGRNLPFL